MKYGNNSWKRLQGTDHRSRVSYRNESMKCQKQYVGM